MKYSTALLLLACCHLGQAQETTSVKKPVKKSATYMGFSVGYVMPTLYGREVDLQMSSNGTYESRNGFEIALQLKHQFSPTFFMKTSLLYTQKGGAVKGSSFVFPMEANLNFLSVPFLIGWQPMNLDNSSGVNFSFESGVSVSSSINSTDSFKKGTITGTTFSYPSPIYSFLLGTSLEIELSDGVMLTFNYRYCKDLNNYFSRTYPRTPTEYETYDVWIKSGTFSGGLLFKL